MKTYKEIWFEIAEAFLTPRKERTERQRTITYSGLCCAVAFVGKAGNDLDVGLRGLCRISFRDVYWLPMLRGQWRFPENYDILRGTMACFFYAMSEKDFKEMCLN